MVSVQQFSFSAIDHLGVVGRDIDVLTTAYKRLGFQPTEPVPLMGVQDGKPVPLGQDSAHLIFTDSYVELSGVTSQDPNHHLAPWLARRNGLHILALGSSNAEDSRATLTNEGFEVPAVQNASRHVDYGQLHGDAQFHWFKVPDTLGDEGFLCIVEQLTPDLVFQPPENGHPNGALGVTGVTVLAGNAEETLSHYSTLPGVTSVADLRIQFGRQFIDVLDTESLPQRYPAAASIAPPALAGFTVSVVSLAETQTYLEDHNITVHTGSDGCLYVSPDDACGAFVAFVQG